MKKIIVLMMLVTVAFSCQRDDFKNSVKDGELFVKTVQVTDEIGNGATVKISGMDKGRVESVKVEDLELFISRKEYKIKDLPEVNNESLEVYDEREDENYFQTVFIDITETELSEEITGFAVRFKKGRVSNRTITDYAFGAEDINGAEVEVQSEDRSSCYLDVDLGKKDAASNWFWQELCDANLSGPGEFVSCIYSTTHWKYRLKMNTQGWRCGDDDKMDWTWIWVRV